MQGEKTHQHGERRATFCCERMSVLHERGDRCQMFRETDHTRAQRACSVASSAGRNKPLWSLKTASPWPFWIAGLFSPRQRYPDDAALRQVQETLLAAIARLRSP